MKIQNIKTEEIKPYALNAKLHPQSQIEGIAESIRRFGFTQPIVIDKNNEIIIGHGRHAAAVMIGLNEVPCLKIEKLNEKEIRALRLIDNRISETGWDHDLLKQEFEDLDYDFSGFGVEFEFFNSEDINSFFDENSNKEIEDEKETYDLVIKFEDESKFELVQSELKKIDSNFENAIIKLILE